MAITISGSGITSANIADGTIVNADVADVAASKLTGALPAIDGSALTNLSAGKVLQVVSATKTDSFSTTASSFTAITGLSVTITPSSTSSKMFVTTDTLTGNDTSGWTTWIQLYRDSTALGQSTTGTAGLNGSSLGIQDVQALSASYLDSPATTSSITYKVSMQSEGSTTAWLNRRGATVTQGGSSSITVMEIGA